MEIVDRGFRRVMERAGKFRLSGWATYGWKIYGVGFSPDGLFIDAVLTVEVIGQAKDLIVENGRYITDPETIRDPLQRLGWCWLERAERHEARSVDEYFRGPTGAPAPDPTVIVQSIAQGLEDASGYLLQAAQRLKDRGDAHGASVTHQRSVEIVELWQGITEGADPADPPQKADPPSDPILPDPPQWRVVEGGWQCSVCHEVAPRRTHTPGGGQCGVIPPGLPGSPIA